MKFSTEQIKSYGMAFWGIAVAGILAMLTFPPFLLIFFGLVGCGVCVFFATDDFGVERKL